MTQDEQKEQARALLAQGVSIRKVAEQTGLNRGAVHRLSQTKRDTMTSRDSVTVTVTDNAHRDSVTPIDHDKVDELTDSKRSLDIELSKLRDYLARHLRPDMVDEALRGPDRASIRLSMAIDALVSPVVIEASVAPVVAREDDRDPLARLL